jgi:hypothetical protein
LDLRPSGRSSAVYIQEHWRVEVARLRSADVPDVEWPNFERMLPLADRRADRRHRVVDGEQEDGFDKQDPPDIVGDPFLASADLLGDALNPNARDGVDVSEAVHPADDRRATKDVRDRCERLRVGRSCPVFAFRRHEG